MRKLGRVTAHRKSMLRNLASDLLWYGRIETTVAKAKDLQSYAEKILTLAINTYDNTVKVNKTVVDADGKKTKVEVLNDGVKKLAARRSIMNRVHKISEVQQKGESKADFVARTKDIKHPLIEKIFNELAPKYAKRKEELGTGGGYTRIIKTNSRQGDSTDMAIIELV